MKTTLALSDVVVKELKKEAAKRGTTMSELVESALRALFKKTNHHVVLPPLPKFDCGGSRVNVANRDALYEVMER